MPRRGLEVILRHPVPLPFQDPGEMVDNLVATRVLNELFPYPNYWPERETLFESQWSILLDEFNPTSERSGSLVD